MGTFFKAHASASYKLVNTYCLDQSGPSAQVLESAMGVVGALTAVATRGLGAPASPQTDPGAALAAASALLNLLKEPAAAQRLAHNEVGVAGLVVGLQARPPCRCSVLQDTPCDTQRCVSEQLSERFACDGCRL